MAKQCRTYTGIDREHLDRIREQLEKHGITFQDGISGTIHAPHGFTIVWNYDEETMGLTVELDGSIFLMGAAWSVVESGIRGTG